MSVTVSVDLAYTRYASIGVAILTDLGESVQVELVKLVDRGLGDPPDSRRLADSLVELCRERRAGVLLLDGPQAWKDPENGLPHQRVCERLLHTPAKTGPPGQVKPANYGPFVAFSIAVFNALRDAGASWLDDADGLACVVGAYCNTPLLALESFPFAAWRGLGLAPLPAKAKSSPEVVRARFRELCVAYGLAVAEPPTHDELQAIVAGLAGVAIGRRAADAYQVVGAAPRLVDGIWREGFIVLPKEPDKSGIQKPGVRIQTTMR